MAATAKISVAMGREELRLAKTAATAEGISLSAFVTRAVRDRLAEQRRLAAAREVMATFDVGDFPSAEEQEAIVTSWLTAKAATATTTKSKRRRGAAPRSR
ncbi:MAG TPA: hypothetical protein VL400_23315 [Polyangiaceae bacterium]|nr:hypothetical protein [Polyangiaceae bacterium]